MKVPDPPSGGPAAMLVDVLARQGTLKQQYNDLTGAVADVSGTTRELAERLTGTEEALEALAERINQDDAVGADDEGDDSDLRQVNWFSLNRPQAEREWERLCSWLADVLISDYAITRKQLPDCWMFHADIRNALSALRVSWAQSVERDAPPVLLVDWHLRQLGGVLERIAATKSRSRCGAGKHAGEKMSADEEAPDEDVLADPASWIDEGREQDLAKRPEPPEPPTE